MITKTTKVLFFAALIVAIAIPISGMDFATGQEQVTKQNLRIDEPSDSLAKQAVHERALAVFDERKELREEGASLKAKYDSEGIESLTPQEISSLDRITEKLESLQNDMDTINADARALITLTQNQKDELHSAVVILRGSEVPFTTLFSDQNGEAVAVGFETEELAEQYAPIIQELIDVKFYTIVEGHAQTVTCTSLTANCDPLLGGVQIATNFSGSTWHGCSYSTATDRNVWWWTDYGFLTAAHCFSNNANGNDVQQPTPTGGKIGDLNIWKWDTSNADCDCAFVKKSGSEQHWKAAYEGSNDSITFGGFADPAVNDYVILVGLNSTIQTLQVEALDATVSLDSRDPTPITHSMVDMIRMDDWGAKPGDSGGVIHADNSNPNYHGIIAANNQVEGSTGKTYASAWSNIDAAFNLND